MAIFSVQQQELQTFVRAKVQRDHDGGLAKWRQKELDAYLDHRDNEGHKDRGR